jgi:TatD DNase family protein
MIDSHTHLDSCEEPNDVLVAEARAAGVRRILTVGMDAESCRSALQAAGDHEEVRAAVGRHPNLAGGFDDDALADLRALSADPGCAAIGETGLDRATIRSAPSTPRSTSRARPDCRS